MNEIKEWWNNCFHKLATENEGVLDQEWIWNHWFSHTHTQKCMCNTALAMKEIENREIVQIGAIFIEVWTCFGVVCWLVILTSSWRLK